MTRRIPLFALALALAAQTAAFGAELFDIPGGLMVRSLLDWENASSLEFKIGGQRFTAPADRTTGVAEHLFSRLELCEDAAYRLVPAASEGHEGPVPPGEWKSLSDYCLSAKPETISFVFISDSQQYHDEHRKTGRFVSQLKSQHPDIRFVLNSGDLVHFGLESEWKKYRAVSSAEYTGAIPLVPVLGNHEFYLDFGLKNFARLYDTAETSNHYYALDFPLFALVVLDSNVEWMSPRHKREQTAWLEKTLSGYQALKKPVMVSFHHAAFTSGQTQYTIPLPPAHIRRHWQPLFEKYGVKAVLNGHEHIYERLDVNGVQHILAGPAGGVISKPGKTSPFSQLLMPGFRSVSQLTVESSGKVHLTTWSVETGRIVDTFDF